MQFYVCMDKEIKILNIINRYLKIIFAFKKVIHSNWMKVVVFFLNFLTGK